MQIANLKAKGLLIREGADHGINPTTQKACNSLSCTLLLIVYCLFTCGITLRQYNIALVIWSTWGFMPISSGF